MKTVKRERKATPVCYLCGGIATTRDHVPPLGMYPAPRPKNLVTVPACESCNRGNSLHDEYFRVTVATGSRDSTQSIALLHQRILPRMRQSPALIAELMKSIRWTAIRSPGGIYLGQAPAFPADRPRRIQTVVDKIVKGLFYKHNKQRLPADQVVAPYLYNVQIEQAFQEHIAGLPLYNIGDGSVFSYRYCIGGGQNPLSVDFHAELSHFTPLFLLRTDPSQLTEIESGEHLRVALVDQSDLKMANQADAKINTRVSIRTGYGSKRWRISSCGHNIGEANA